MSQLAVAAASGACLQPPLPVAARAAQQNYEQILHYVPMRIWDALGQSGDTAELFSFLGEIRLEASYRGHSAKYRTRDHGRF